MSLNSDLQKLEVGSKIRLFEVDGSSFDGPVLRFHSYNLAHTPEEIAAANGDESKLLPKSIYWQGHEYGAWPCEIEGIETTSDGRSAEPTLTVANIDYSVTALCKAYNDMARAKVTIHDTLAHYLDARNFPEGNPSADPLQEKISIYYIDNRANEDDEYVSFGLRSPLDLQGMRIPCRQIHSLCTWAMNGWYRTGKGCAYSGAAMFDENDNPTDDPSKDKCAGLMASCKNRFGANNPLDFGGFPASSLIRS